LLGDGSDRFPTESVIPPGLGLGLKVTPLGHHASGRLGCGVCAFHEILQGGRGLTVSVNYGIANVAPQCCFTRKNNQAKNMASRVSRFVIKLVS